MFTHARDLEGLQIAAEDGEIGQVTDLYFDDTAWVIRYLVVSTGSWLFGKKVLISPNSVERIDWSSGCLRVRLSREQVRESPDIDTDRPISRQQEADYHLYYNFPPYWGGVALWGRYEHPGSEADSSDRESTHHDRSYGSRWDSHLRSAKEVRGYRIIAIDGEAGHVDTFLVEPATWAIRYILVNTGSRLSRHEVVCTPKLVDRVVWADAVVTVNTSRNLMETAAEYVPDSAFSREDEQRLFEHYSVHPYWEQE